MGGERIREGALSIAGDPDRIPQSRVIHETRVDDGTAGRSGRRPGAEEIGAAPEKITVGPQKLEH